MTTAGDICDLVLSKYRRRLVDLHEEAIEFFSLESSGSFALHRIEL
jgi:hypothetical protein